MFTVMLFGSLFFNIHHNQANAQSDLVQDENEEIVYSEVYLIYPEDENIPNNIESKEFIENNKELVLKGTDELRNELRNELIKSEDSEIEDLPSGHATLTCNLDSNDLVCDWTSILYSDYITYVNQKLDYYSNGYWIHEDQFNYPNPLATRSVSDQGEVKNAISGEWRMHLNGSVTGRYAVYQLHSYSKYIDVP
ncbi:hypothetical protein [Tenuibacillus multivorans]|uniref:Uncharacterized protein n=1 Tax=Tenuibacillus multivorans TaxID=237069 RepID=A0A1G9ZP68_9BACI|nr:hypothetical protein [Tenuibacillus multivorans]SDN22895.1 hypothetical protein SAMN05216498_1779 [Tenuibacillus multivorans]